MERDNQNLKFQQNCSGKSELSLQRKSQHRLSLSAKNKECNELHTNENHLLKTVKESNFDKNSSKSITSLENNEDVQGNSKSIINALLRGPISKKRANIPISDVGSILKSELFKYKKELREYNKTTKELEDKYEKLNLDLNDMQSAHDRFVALRKNINENEISTDSSSTGSEYSLKRKFTQVFNRDACRYEASMTIINNTSSGNSSSSYSSPNSNDFEATPRRKRRRPPSSNDSLMQIILEYQRHSKRNPGTNENDLIALDEITAAIRKKDPSINIKDIYKILKHEVDKGKSISKTNCGIDHKDLISKIHTLQNEQAQFRTIIQQQQVCLHDYHTRCIKAQNLMQSQQIEIEKLNSNNQQLENEIGAGIDRMRAQIDDKLRDVAHLPHMLREEQLKREKFARDNVLISERLRAAQIEAVELKTKLDELNRRKSSTISRLKIAERDLKIFKNHNMALKDEKRRIMEEMGKIKETLEVAQATSKRSFARQRDVNEKQRRDLQKRVYELEYKLSRSETSTSSLIQDRDALIADLQNQLNTFVHNFEVSQRHIRVLRRHIYSMANGTVNAAVTH